MIWGVVCEAHPREKLSEATFREYVKAIDGGTILQMVRQVVSKTEVSRDVQRSVQEMLDLNALSAVTCNEIVDSVSGFPLFVDLDPTLDTVRRNTAETLSQVGSAYLFQHVGQQPKAGRQDVASPGRPGGC